MPDFLLLLPVVVFVDILLSHTKTFERTSSTVFGEVESVALLRRHFVFLNRSRHILPLVEVRRQQILHSWVLLKILPRVDQSDFLCFVLHYCGPQSWNRRRVTILSSTKLLNFGSTYLHSRISFSMSEFSCLPLSSSNFCWNSPWSSTLSYEMTM